MEKRLSTCGYASMLTVSWIVNCEVIIMFMLFGFLVIMSGLIIILELSSCENILISRYYPVIRIFSCENNRRGLLSNYQNILVSRYYAHPRIFSCENNRRVQLVDKCNYWTWSSKS